MPVATEGTLNGHLRISPQIRHSERVGVIAGPSDSEWMVLAGLFNPEFLTKHRAEVSLDVFQCNGVHRVFATAAIEMFDEHGANELLLVGEKVSGAGVYARHDIDAVIRDLIQWSVFKPDRIAVRCV